MAIESFMVRCGTCESRIRIRAGIGHDTHQPHSLTCPKCAGSLTFELSVDRSRGLIAISALGNIAQIPLEEGSEDFVLNSHPDYLIPQDRLHDPHYFAFVEQVFPLGLLRAQNAFGRLRALLDLWPSIKQVMPLYLNGRLDLFVRNAAEILGESPPARHTMQATAQSQYWEIQHHLNTMLLTPSKAKQLLSVQRSVSMLRRRSIASLKVYWEYVRTNHEEHLVVQSHKIVSRILGCLQILRPLIVSKLCEVPAQRFGELPRLTTFCFEKLSTLYGEVYEAVGDFSLHFACLNNIRLRKSYDRFESWSLADYVASDKAGRANPFKGYHTFGDIILPHYDNELRNASHHSRMRYEVDTGLVFYWPRPGPTSKDAAKAMPLWIFLEKSYELVQVFGILVSLHHGLEVLLNGKR